MYFCHFMCLVKKYVVITWSASKSWPLGCPKIKFVILMLFLNFIQRSFDLTPCWTVFSGISGDSNCFRSLHRGCLSCYTDHSGSVKSFTSLSLSLSPSVSLRSSLWRGWWRGNSRTTLSSSSGLRSFLTPTTTAKNTTLYWYGRARRERRLHPTQVQYSLPLVCLCFWHNQLCVNSEASFHCSHLFMQPHPHL